MKVDVYRPDYYIIDEVPRELIKLMKRHGELSQKEFLSPEHRYHKEGSDGTHDTPIGMDKEEWKEFEEIEKKLREEWVLKFKGVIPESVYKDLVYLESTYLAYHDDKRVYVCPCCTCCGRLPIPEDATPDQVPWKKE